MKTVELLTKFVNQRPGLDFANYGDVKLYRSEMNEITKDLHDYRELISLALRRYGSELEGKLNTYLKNNSGRLTLVESEGKEHLEYCTGQYFPTEYRPAANRVLANLIFADYRDEKESNSPNPIYKDGNAIRKAIKSNVSRRVMKGYFN